MRRRFTRGRSRKRSVAWIPGFTSFDDLNSVTHRLLTFAAVPNTTATWSVAVELTDTTDLSLHGGEDAVIERIRGQLAFTEGRRNAGAGLGANGFQVRVVVYQSLIAASAAAGVANDAFTTSDDMGKDNILFMDHTVVSATAIGATGAGFDTMAGGLMRWMDIDIKAKRRIQVDRPILLTLQTVLPVGTTGADCRMLGGLRMLLKRPR